MPALSATRWFDRERLERIADGLAIALAVSLPWSSSATSILVVLWFLAVLPTLAAARMREIVLTPAGGLPIALVLLALLGTLWSPVPWPERFINVVPFARLLVIPLLLFQFSRSPRGAWVVYGLIASCIVLLVTSYWYFLGKESGWYPFTSRYFGVPVKDYISQSGFFTICAFALLELATIQWSASRRLRAAMLVLLALLFLANIALVATGRISIVVIAVLLVVFALRRASAKARLAVVVAGLLLAGLAWLSSGYLRERVLGAFSEIHAYLTAGDETSSGLRLEYARHAVTVIAQAPIIGHGTGSMATVTKLSANTIPNTDNPHNQTFTIGIQLGLIGVALLYAMWLTHLWLFRGHDWLCWIALAVVIQNVVASLTNSYLFDFTSGWTYAVLVGVIGGTLLRPGAKPAAAEPQTSRYR